VAGDGGPFPWRGNGARSPSNTMSPGLRPTSVPSGILILLRVQIQPRLVYTVFRKNGTTMFLPLTLPNAGQFSKFFHQHT